MTEDTTLLRADTGAPVTFANCWTTAAKASSSGRSTTLGGWSRPDHHVFPSGVKEVYRLRLASGREVKASGNHPFLTFGGWMALDRLAVGDRIAVPRRIPGARSPPVSAGPSTGSASSHT